MYKLITYVWLIFQDIIIKEAVNLAPAELEGILYKNPDVVKALVGI